MHKSVEPILIDPDTPIRRVMEIINEAPHKGAVAGIALVVDREKYVKGVISDGDIRRATLRGIPLDAPAETIMITDPITVRQGLSGSEMIKEITKKLNSTDRIKNKKIEKVIIVDESGRIEDVITIFDLWKKNEMSIKNICVIGLGYVGLTLAVSLADVGFTVAGIDKNPAVITTLGQGKPHFHEQGLDTILKHRINKSFSVHSTFDSIASDVYIICVDTPVDEFHIPKMENLKNACESIGKIVKRDDLVILRSTVPIGTSRTVVLPILEERSGLRCGTDFFLAFAPERTLAGKALEELRTLPQIVGGFNEISADMASNIFKRLTPTIVTAGSLEAAEMIKLMDNSYRDLIFAFSNELALVCDKFNLDTVKLIRAANEGYVRNRIPLPSPGVGGSCLTKDPYILIHNARQKGYTLKLTRSAREINEFMPLFIAEKIFNFLDVHNIAHSRAKMFIMGFAFKGSEETSDIRKSPAIELLAHLRSMHPDSPIYGYDAVVQPEVIRDLGVLPCDIDTGFEDADVVVIMNNHKSFSDMDIYAHLEKMHKPGLFFDGWHTFPKEIISNVEGIFYGGLGVE